MKNNLTFLAIAVGVAMFAFGKKKTRPPGLPVPGVPGVPGVPTTRKARLNTPIGKAEVPGRNRAQRIIDGYPARPGAAAGAASFAHDWGGQAALEKTVGYWLPMLKKELRARREGDPFRARSEVMLVLIQQYLARR